MAGQDAVPFAGVLRRLRTDAGLTQEELAEAAGLTARSVSDPERGINLTARKDTARLLADALSLSGQARAEFEAAARGRPVPDGAGPAVAVTRTLPRDIASFTGRQRQRQDLVDAVAGSAGMVTIHAIGGMVGIGKTAFAVHAAHRLAGRFPAGQIFLPLHGHTPGQRPVDPGDALASLLVMAGVAAGQIPAGVEARMALWRDRLAGRQLLLVLDDAASSEQVSPLLPGAGGSLVLITSRRHLSALDGATAISLDTLPADEAASLLVRLTARTGLSPADPAVAEITRLCGYLPLAIGMVARQLHHHPAWSAAGHAAELTQARDRLELLATENLSVTAAFNLSYEELTADQQRLFRRLGLHPGTDIDAYAGAALDGTDLAAARRGLEALYDRYLLAEPARGRYRLHDLIREHARALAGQFDPDPGQATARLLDYYRHTAILAGTRLARQTRPGISSAASAGISGAPCLDDGGQALAWERAERANLLACLDHVADTGQHAQVMAFTAALAPLWRRDGPWADAIARHTTAVRAARALGDRIGEANALTDLGDVREMTGDNAGAVQVLEQALDIYRDLGEQLGQAYALNNLGASLWLTGNYPGAARALEQALSICRALGSRLGQANALKDLGVVRRMSGDHQGAEQALGQALGINRDLGYRSGEAETLNETGTLHRIRGDLASAEQCHQRSLELARAIPSSWDEACALAGLARCAAASGRIAQAEALLRQAHQLFQRIGAAETAAVQAELTALTGSPRSG